jgi:hypothetical protein
LKATVCFKCRGFEHEHAPRAVLLVGSEPEVDLDRVVFSFDERFPSSRRYADSEEYGEKYNMVDPF